MTEDVENQPLSQPKKPKKHAKDQSQKVKNLIYTHHF